MDRRSLERAGVGALVTALLSCGGGDSGLQEESARPAFSVARLSSGSSALELPVVQSGSRLYADVRLALAADGAFQLLSSRSLAATSAPVDAVLDPPMALADIGTSLQPVRLRVRRMHIDAGVYQDVLLELKEGRWRLAARPVPATTLTAADFEANADLQATAQHLVVLRSEPGRSQTIPIHLGHRGHRFCMPAQEEGADELALLDAQGSVLASARAGGECMKWEGEAGDYKLRHTYGGTGARRTVFLRLKPGGAPLVAQRAAIPAWAAVPKSASDPEYWALVANYSDPAGSAFLGTISCSWVAAFLAPWSTNQSYTYTGVPGTFSAGPLLDPVNFFQRVDDWSGQPAQLGGALGCPGTSLGAYGMTDSWVPQGWIQVQPSDKPYAFHPWGPVHIEGRTDDGNLFRLSGSDYKTGALVPIGFPGGPIGQWISWYLDWVGMQTVSPLLKNQPTFRVALRYRPGSVARSQLAQGQVALFNSGNCTGPALLVDQQGLPAIPANAPMGTFSGSMLLGPQTSAVIWDNAQSTQSVAQFSGSNHTVFADTCIGSPFGGAFTALSVTTDAVEMVAGTNECEYCNLAGVVLTGQALGAAKLGNSILDAAWLDGALLAGADLSNASLHGAHLDNANLDGASLCSAFLNGSDVPGALGPGAASLNGAYLRNANLKGANLSNVHFNFASFFSSNPVQCQPSSCSPNQGCASAHAATISGTLFNNAYLANTDFSKASGPGANFGSAILLNARFSSASIGGTDADGAYTSFNAAYLMGADFTGVTGLEQADFGNSYADPGSGCWEFNLGSDALKFPGLQVPSPPMSTSYTCVPPPAAPATSCQQVSYSALPVGATGPPVPKQLPAPGPWTSACGTGAGTSASYGICGDGGFNPLRAPGINYCFQK